MVAVIRRMILLVSLMFWQGGFMFYGGVVVPVGGRILESETQQGFITQSVTDYLNLAGALCLSLWLENLFHERRTGVSKLEWGLWGFAACSLVVLVVVHGFMDQNLGLEPARVLNPRSFDRSHKVYIGTSSLQWLACLAMLFLAILRWNKKSSEIE